MQNNEIENNSLVSLGASTIIDVASSVKNYWKNDTSSIFNNILLQQENNQKILKLANILNCLDEKINVPKLVVVGSQSSGKSSLLNSILSFDILPTGKNMVTRTPLNLELISSNENINQIIFGNYNNGYWQNEIKINFSLPIPSENEIKKIHNEILSQTIKKAGSEMNISNKPIYLRILSNQVPDLTLVDLPGMTMVACTDKGQPIDIKQQINSLISETIEDSNVIILAVIPARPDIETDIGLELVKSKDPEGKRTIGVLTKLDLMNENTDITNYLNNTSNFISKDLILHYGYYAVKCNCLLKEETNYFYNHPIYSSYDDQSKIGTKKLTEQISQILLTKLYQQLPYIHNKINEKLNLINDQVGDLEYSNDITHIHYLVNYFIDKYLKIINGRNENINTGKNIKNIFINFRKNLHLSNPFIEKNKFYDNINEIIENSQGNHMHSESPSIEILELVLKNEEENPLINLKNPSINSLNLTKEEVKNLLKKILNFKQIKVYSNLKNKIEFLINQKINEFYDISLNIIKEQILIQENYIWTDNNEFENYLMNFTNSKDDYCTKIINLLDIYYKSISEELKCNIPKLIMYYFIKNLNDFIKNNLYSLIMEDTTGLLDEDNEFKNEKNKLIKLRNSLVESKKIISSIK